jgi:hypothetical protein
MDMRWVFVIIFIAMMTCNFPIHHTYHVEAENQDFSIIGPGSMVIHQDEEKYTYVTIHNTKDVFQNFTIDVSSIPLPLETVNLPISEILVNNHLRQFQIGFYAPSNTTFGIYPVVLEISSNIEGVMAQYYYLNITVAPYSNLDFWVGESSNLLVDGGIRASVAVNITNNASLEDLVKFDLVSSSKWAWGWVMTNTENGSAYISMQPGTIHYVYFWIDVPNVKDAMPLAGTGPVFTLMATSGLDLEVTEWDLNLKMSTFRNVTIDRSDGLVQMAPGQDGRLKIDVRNNGNVPNRMNITLQAIDQDGIPLQNMPASDRFSSDGWTIALFGGLEDVELEPNQTRVVEIGFQAPYEFEGSFSVQLRIFPNQAIERLKTINVYGEIIRNKSMEATYQSSGCMNILPGETCENSITITNNGNARDTYYLRQTEPDDHINVTLPTNSITIENGFTNTFEDIIFHAKNGSLAFTQGEIEIELLDDSFSFTGLIKIPYKIGPKVMWNFSNITETINRYGLMEIQMNVRNDGNAIDGLLVQLQSSHNTEMAFIPPFIAEVEEGVENPRSFEVNDIPLGYNFTIKAWVQLPMDQTSNGTVFINTSIRSKFAPEIEFLHTSQGEYLGIPWQPVPNVDPGITLPEFVSTSIAYLKAWSGVLFAILLSGLIIYKAIWDRNKRLEEIQQHSVAEQKPIETEEDWLAKFQRKEQQTSVDEQKEIPSQAFESMFRMRAQPKEVTPGIEEEMKVHSSAVLQQGELQRTQEQANAILSSIQEHGVAKPHPENEHLHSKEHNPERTLRHDRQQLLSNDELQDENLDFELPEMIDLDDL